jgi:hypothetical protein
VSVHIMALFFFVFFNLFLFCIPFLGRKVYIHRERLSSAMGVSRKVELTQTLNLTQTLTLTPLCSLILRCRR